MHKTAISGLVALTALLGGAVAAQATATAQPRYGVHPAALAAVRTEAAGPLADAVRLAERAWQAGLARPASLTKSPAVVRAAETTQEVNSAPMVSCVLTSDCLGVESAGLQVSGLGVGGIVGGAGSAAAAAAKAAAPVRVARWNGAAWKGVGVALPKGTKQADVTGVSCKGAKSCLVVGTYYTSTSDTALPHALVLGYNGTSLKPTAALALPKGAALLDLTDVSCASTRYCVATGLAEASPSGSSAGGLLTLIEVWNGGKWTLRKTIAETTQSSGTKTGKAVGVEISGVSCATVAFCVMTGDTITITVSGNSSTATLAPYFGFWNGAKLTATRPAAIPRADNFAIPSALSCATQANCAVAVLAADDNSNAAPTTFIERWNGKAWQLAKTPWPAADTVARADGMSCYGAHACEAVGLTSTDALTIEYPTVHAVAVSYDGGAGSVQAVPAPPKGYSNVLVNVSCLPWGSCVAVGLTGKTGAATGAVMTGVWNGRAWKLHPGF